MFPEHRSHASVLSFRRRHHKTLVAWASVAAVLVASGLGTGQLMAYQAGGTATSTMQTGYSGLTTSITTTGSITREVAGFMNSGRDWSVTGTTYTPNISSQRGLQFVTSGQGCSYPNAGATTGSCGRGNVTFTFSRPVLNPVFHIHDFGGRMEATCKLAIQGTLTRTASTPGSVTMSKISGGITVSGSSITGRTSTAPMTENDHSSGSVRITGLLQSITFSLNVILTRQGSTCAYDQNTMLISAVERLNATFSYDEDFGDGPATYDAPAAASHVIGDLRMGANALTIEAASTLNSATTVVAASPIASSSASGDNDDAISGSPPDANIGQDYSLTVPITGASQGGQVCGFIDMNNSGTYTTSSPDERACTSFASGDTSATLTWTASQWPGDATPVAATGLRLRAAYGSTALDPTGPADSGEVEDHLVTLVSPVPPVANPLTSTGTQGENQTFVPTVSQGNFVAGNTCLVSGGGCASTLTIPGEGTYTVNGNGSITFAPEPNFTGAATPVNYRVEDSQGRQSTSTLTPTVVATPTATNDSAQGVYNTAATIDVLANDSAAQGATLDATSVLLCATGETPPNCTATTVVVPNQGTFTRDGTTGEVTFTPLSTFTGTASIDYQVADSLGGVDSARVNVNVQPPTAPAASPTTSAGIIDANQNITLNASAGAGTTLDPLRTCIVSNASCVRTLTVAGEGVYTVNADGTVTFDPDPTFTGVATPQVYRVEDVTGQMTHSSLSVTVTGPPTVVNDTSTGPFDTDQVVSVLSNDAAGTGATLDPQSVRVCAGATSNASCTTSSLTVPNEGTWTANADGTVTFDPLPTFVGNATPVKYVVSDDLSQRSSGQVTATVNPPPAVVATADTSVGIAGQSQTVNPLTNDIAPAGVTLTAPSVRLCGAAQSPPNCTATSLTVPNEGTYSVNTTTGEVTFAPVAGFGGDATSQTYVASDSLSRIFTSTYTPSVVPPPTVVNDTSSGAYDTDQVVTVLSNDAAGTGATLDPQSVRVCATATSNASCTTSSLTVPNEGTWTANADGTVTFDPLPTFVGNATPVKYVVADSLGQKSDGTVSVQVATPPAPVATPESKPLLPGQSVSFTSVTSASGLVSGGLTVAGNVQNGPCLVDPADSQCKASVSIPNEGSWSIDQSTGVTTFTAAAGVQPGTLTPVTFRTTDILGRVATATLTPVIPAAPVAAPDTATTTWNTTAAVTVLSNDTLGTGVAPVASSVKLCSTGETAPACTASSVTVAGEGTHTVQPDGTVRFVPESGFTGQATPVSYRMTDSLGQVAHSSITVTVQVPPAAIATSQTKQVNQGGTVVFSPVLGAEGLTTAATGAPALVAGSLCIVDPATDVCGSGPVTVAGVGTYVLEPATGTVTFTAAADATPGTAQGLTYQVTDALGRMVSGVLTPEVTVGPVARDDASVSSADSATVLPIAGFSLMVLLWISVVLVIMGLSHRTMSERLRRM